MLEGLGCKSPPTTYQAHDHLVPISFLHKHHTAKLPKSHSLEAQAVASITQGNKQNCRKNTLS